ncbi:hypothetical protein DFH28DRAFT_860826, partial [Melampsora americana]
EPTEDEDEDHMIQLYENQTEIINETRNLMMFLDNNISNSSVEDNCDEELLTKAIWPVFSNAFQEPPNEGRRKDRDGNIIKLRKPVINPKNPTGRLLPKPIPKQTKSSRKKT